MVYADDITITSTQTRVQPINTYIHTYIQFFSLDKTKQSHTKSSVFIEGTNYDKVIDIVHNELERINIWIKDNKLTVNIKKSNYMMFHRTRIKHNLHNITICDMNVTCTKNTKFLGVIIDNKLRWSDHINYIKNKISKSIGIINNTRNFLNKNTLRNL